MMSVILPSEELWEILHRVKASVTHEGFCEKIPKLPQGNSQHPRDLGLQSIRSHWQDRLAIGSAWPIVNGARWPKAILLTIEPLSAVEFNFVQRWFENDRLKLIFENDFQVHPWPDFPINEDGLGYFQEIFADLCPKIIISLGAEPASCLLRESLSLQTLRSGDFPLGEFWMITMHHPRDILTLPDTEIEKRNLWKAQVWKDAQRIAGKIRLA